MRNGVSPEPLLEVRGLTAGFDAGPVLFGIDLEVAPSELVALVGANGAGKSTLLGVLSGLVRATSGSISLAGEDVTNARPEVLVRKGVAHVPQGRRLFGTMSVEKNLLLGAYLRRDGEIRGDLVRVLDLFPALKDKLSREAGTLSGGEQQMVAIGRGLMARPKLLMVDELSLGLAPKVVDHLIEVIQQINREGTALILVEQDVLVALDAANRAYVLENGRVALSGKAADVKEDPGVRRAYLGL
ncbi:MAG: branched-chain amino acid ABC transporter ATP-binding protein [Actinobacteria bacterium 13_1_20CM_2_65_11]|nr:MAG: branched-chain amino acid ABC transporter ATP-binding protein [Actinobacteria bacterium 13_1_20CM_2_65_11]